LACTEDVQLHKEFLECKTPDVISYGESLRLVRTGELPKCKPRSGALTAVGHFSEINGE